MWVNLSYVVQNPYHFRDDIKFIDENDHIPFIIAKFFDVTKNYLKHFIRNLGYQTSKHYRLIFYIPECPADIFIEKLQEQTSLRNILNISGINFSVHTNYRYNAFRSAFSDTLINHYTKLVKLAEHLGIHDFITCNHLYSSNKRECIETLDNLFIQVPNLYKCFCIENGDKSADFNFCLDVCSHFAIPLIYDNFHNKLNGQVNLAQHTNKIVNLWQVTNRIPIIHYSNGTSSGTHGYEIYKDEFDDVLDIFSQHTDEIIAIVELKQPRIAISEFINEYFECYRWDNLYRFNTHKISYHDFFN